MRGTSRAALEDIVNVKHAELSSHRECLGGLWPTIAACMFRLGGKGPASSYELGLGWRGAIEGVRGELGGMGGHVVTA
jgi:hypothetical protein